MKKNKFFKNIFHRKKQSVWVAVLGKKQSGKTSFCLWLMELLFELGLMDAFGSNVPIENPPFPIDFIEDFQTLEKRCRLLNPDPKRRGLKRYFFFASEMGKWLPKDQSWRNVSFIEKLQTVRKYGLSWAGDAIDRVDERALSPIHFQGCFTKLSQTDPTIAEYEDWSTWKRTLLKNIPNTTLDFDTWYSANFYMTPQTPDTLNIPLPAKHELAKKYVELGSWKKAGVDTKKGKRAVMAVLRFHFSHCLNELPQENDTSEEIKPEIVRDSVKVAE